MRKLQIDRLQIGKGADDNPHMTNTIQEKIQKILTERNLSPEAASKNAGLDRGYLAKLFSRPDASPRADTLKKIADSLGVSVAHFLGTGVGDFVEIHHLAPGEEAEPDLEAIALTPAEHRRRHTLPSGDTRPADVQLPARFTMPNDIPVRGTAAGSHLKGAFQLTSDEIDYVRRPPALAAAKGIYALYVEGSSMEPQYFPGDLIYINPNKPPRFGDAVVVQCHTGEGDSIEATLGILAKRTAETLVITKRNPAADVELDRKYIIDIHKVLTINELFGV